MYKWKKVSRSVLGKDTGLVVKHAEYEQGTKEKTEEKHSDSTEEVESVIIASEPIYRAEKAWNLVPANHVLIVTPRNDVIMEPIDLSTIREEELHLNVPVTGVIITPAPHLLQPPSPEENQREGTQQQQQNTHVCCDGTQKVLLQVSDEKGEEPTESELKELQVEASLASRRRTKHHNRPSISLMVREKKTPSPVPSKDYLGSMELVLPIPEDAELSPEKVGDEDFSIERERTKHHPPTVFDFHQEVKPDPLRDSVLAEQQKKEAEEKRKKEEEEKRKKEEEQEKEKEEEKEQQESEKVREKKIAKERKEKEAISEEVKKTSDDDGALVLRLSIPKHYLALLLLNVVIIVFLHYFFRNMLCSVY